jgi:hypothetical protein
MSGIASASLSDAQANQILGIVSKQIQLALTSSATVQPGQPVTAAVIPSAPVIDVSELASGVLNLAWIAKDVLFDKKDPVKVPTTTEMTSPIDLDGDELAATAGDIVAGQPLLRPQHLNLAWTAKDVIFKKPDPVDIPDDISSGSDELIAQNAIAGGQPLQPPAPVIGLPAPTTSNVPGIVGQVFGGINVPPPPDPGAPLEPVAGILNQIFGTIVLPNLKVQLKVKWIVRDNQGNELQEGRDFIATQGLTSPNVSLILPPVFRELRLDTLLKPGGEVVCLSARVVLMLGEKTLSVTLGPIPILLLPLLIPTVVVLFSEPNFGLTHDSAALIVVSKHSPFASAEPLFKTLKKIEAVVSALRGLGGLAAFFLGLDELLGTVPDQPRLRFATTRVDPNKTDEGEGIPHLSEIKIKRRPWYNLLGDDPAFDDVVSSLIVFGLPGTKVQFFDHTHFDSTDGSFDIELNEKDFFVAVRTLDTDDRFAPETFPPDRVPDFEPSSEGSWDNSMDSLRFHKDWSDDVEEKAKTPLVAPPLICKQKKRGGAPAEGQR